MIHPIPTDVLFHVERYNEDGRVDTFRRGDLVLYNGEPAVIIDVPDTVLGHYIETPVGGLICLDLATILQDGKKINVETWKIFHILCPSGSK
jgi:hypothetical protein